MMVTRIESWITIEINNATGTGIESGTEAEILYRTGNSKPVARSIGRSVKQPVSPADAPRVTPQRRRRGR
ncbi:hypothetical protein EVAR_97966_1 [Eumeta japonica]|uniref:Uncharacterized protein n=1 Tax=Eumeta variegata TaxID=151549 RepID=A0A4C1XI27_EUMVA|nr:hypothetical protein EVAR_97966_1 [Eumeta japonica]